MIIHLFVEGVSEAALLGPWLKRFQPGHSHKIVVHEGKGRLPDDPSAKPNLRHRGLLDQLPAKLRAYGKAMDPTTERLLVLVDADNDDCGQLKQSMVDVWNSVNSDAMAMFRIAVEETEAFYLGDRLAIQRAFGRVKTSVYRGYVQDSVCGTWEVFMNVIDAKHVAKVRWAETISPELNTNTTGARVNRSESFRQFMKALRILAGETWP